MPSVAVPEPAPPPAIELPTLIPSARPRLLMGRFRIVGIVAVCVLLLSTAAVALWGMAGAAPSWWKPLNLAEPKVIELAQTVENHLASTAHAYRGRPAPSAENADVLVTGEPWTITVTSEQANAWLNTRLPQWIDGRDDAIEWPREFSELQVDFADGLVRVGVFAQAAGASQYFSASFVPTIRDGALWLEVRTLALGRLGLPAGWFISALADDPKYVSTEIRRDARTQRLLDALAGERSLTDDPCIPLSDGRCVRLLGVRVLPGAIELRCRTEVQSADSVPPPRPSSPVNVPRENADEPPLSGDA